MTYKFQVDGHIIEVEIYNGELKRIWYCYNNNNACCQLFYDITKDLIYGANITERQKEIIKRKINKILGGI